MRVWRKVSTVTRVTSIPQLTRSPAWTQFLCDSTGAGKGRARALLRTRSHGRATAILTTLEHDGHRHPPTLNIAGRKGGPYHTHLDTCLVSRPFFCVPLALGRRPKRRSLVEGLWSSRSRCLAICVERVSRNTLSYDTPKTPFFDTPSAHLHNPLIRTSVRTSVARTPNTLTRRDSEPHVDPNITQPKGLYYFTFSIRGVQVERTVQYLTTCAWT